MAMPIPEGWSKIITCGLITRIFEGSFNWASATKKKVTLKFPMVKKSDPARQVEFSIKITGNYANFSVL